MRHDAVLNLKAALLGLLALEGLAFLLVWALALRDGAGGRARPSAYELLVGAITDFFDTLGIGSFATTTSLYKVRQLVPDRLIPGTLNVGHTLPTLAQAFIYIAIVRVDAVTLALLVGSAVAGAWIGAGVVAGWPRRAIQSGLGVALLGAAALLVVQQLDILPRGGDAVMLRGIPLAAGMVGNFVLGALMTLGIGLYAPCMVLVALLGMSPAAAFPIMMGSCAFLMPVASARFVARSAYVPSAAVGLALGGLPAVLVAAWIVRQLPLATVRWLVLAVVLYAAQSLLRDARRRGP